MPLCPKLSYGEATYILLSMISVTLAEFCIFLKLTKIESYSTVYSQLPFLNMMFEIRVIICHKIRFLNFYMSLSL